MSERQFCDFAAPLGVSEEQAKLAYDWIRSGLPSGQPVLGARVAEELKKGHDRYTKQFAAEMEQQAGEIIRVWERKYKAKLADVFGCTNPKDDGTLKKIKLEESLKSTYSQATAADLKTVLGLLPAGKAGTIPVAEVQNFLRRFTPARMVSIRLWTWGSHRWR